MERLRISTPDIKNIASRALPVSAALAVGLTIAEAFHPQVVDAQAVMCQVGQNIKAVTYKDKFLETGKGRPHIYDGSVIDEEVGPATGIIVYAITKDGKSLGQVAVGPEGQAKILNIKQPCNTKGPNGKPALEWNTYTSQNPEHKMPVVAENGYEANSVIGRELKQAPRPTQTQTQTPDRTPTPLPTATPVRPTPDVTPVATILKTKETKDDSGNLMAIVEKYWLPVAAGLAVVGGIIGGVLLIKRRRQLATPAQPAPVAP